MTERIPRVGDHVILRFVGADWEVSYMEKYLGKEQEISDVFGTNHQFRIRSGRNWVWRPISIERWLDDVADPPDDNEISDFLGLRS